MGMIFGTGPKKLPTTYMPKSLVDNVANDAKRSGKGIVTVLDAVRRNAEEVVVEHKPEPDKEYHETPDDIALKDPSLEVVLPEAIKLTVLSPRLLAPAVLPGLWQTSEITLKEVREYFAGGHVVHLPREGYAEPVTIPQAEGKVIAAAVHAAVKEGTLWLTSGPASIFSEDIPAGMLTNEALLHAPPQSVSALEVVEQNLPEAWSNGTTTALVVSTALAKKVGKTLPWVTIREALNGALRARLLERTLASGPWPCDYVGAQAVQLQLCCEPQPEYPRIPTPPQPSPGVLVAEADLRLNEIQDLADSIATIGQAAVGFDLKLHLRLEAEVEPLVRRGAEIIRGLRRTGSECRDSCVGLVDRPVDEHRDAIDARSPREGNLLGIADRLAVHGQLGACRVVVRVKIEIVERIRPIDPRVHLVGGCVRARDGEEEVVARRIGAVGGHRVGRGAGEGTAAPCCRRVRRRNGAARRCRRAHRGSGERERRKEEERKGAREPMHRDLRRCAAIRIRRAGSAMYGTGIIPRESGSIYQRESEKRVRQSGFMA